MNPATWPRAARVAERLLHVDPASGRLHDGYVRDLPALLAPGDLLIVNDAATLPASLRARSGFELRLLGRLAEDTDWRAIAFGAGDWRTPTEARPEPPSFAEGSRIQFSDQLSASVLRVDPDQPRLIDLRFDQRGSAFYTALYRAGRPIQYAYLCAPLELYHVQNTFAARPWAVELASAGRPLRFGLLRELHLRGVGLAAVTHAAGLSSTGSGSLDRRLPVPERYALPEATVRAIQATRARGARVVAAGTTVVRALESAALERADGALEAHEGEAKLVIGPGFRPRVVDGLLTGMHAPGTSHFALLEAFAPRALLEQASDHAERAGYLEHEFGDSCLVLPLMKGER